MHSKSTLLETLHRFRYFQEILVRSSERLMGKIVKNIDGDLDRWLCAHWVHLRIVYPDDPHCMHMIMHHLLLYQSSPELSYFSLLPLEDDGDDAEAADAGCEEPKEDVGGGDEPEGEDVHGAVAVVLRVRVRGVHLGLVYPVHPHTAFNGRTNYSL